jgi:histidinol-phosphate aminotransferase
MTVTDMTLNHGTICSERCVEVLRRHDSNTALRAYPRANNDDLRAAIAAFDGVAPENVLVANGSGPLLKACIPFLIEKKIKASPARMLRYLLRRRAYPIMTPRFTYSKVPSSALRLGLRCEILPLGPDDGFALDLDDLAARLSRGDGLVYLANPNNPTGNLLATRAQLEPLLRRFPRSIFFVDEAYTHYLFDDAASVVDRAPHHENLVVTRSLSFAFGLASARVGYAVANRDLIATLDAKLTPYRVGRLSEELAIAALSDREHLARVRREVRHERDALVAAMRGLDAVEPFPSSTNYVLCRARAPLTGRQVHDGLLARGVKVKIFEPLGEERFEAYFRVTVGLPHENEQYLEALGRVLGASRAGRPAARPAPASAGAP